MTDIRLNYFLIIMLIIGFACYKYSMYLHGLD